MVQIVLIAIAAGTASTLLFASVTSGSLLSIPLFNLAPLPILIAGVGWSHLAALLAMLLAALALGVSFGGLLFLNFVIGVGLPAWWLSYLLMLARPAQGPAGAVEWYPIGRLVVWASLLAALIVTLVIFMVASDVDELRAALRRSLAAVLRVPGQATEAADSEQSSRLFMQVLTESPERVLPPAAAVLTTLMQAFTLWLAARVVLMSGRLRRPWTDISAMTFPPTVLAILAAALVAALLPGLMGVIASVVAASLLTAYALLGLAVMHALTQAVGGRGFILGSLYGGILIFGWPLLMMSLLGLADLWLDLRSRVAGRPPPPPART